MITLNAYLQMLVVAGRRQDLLNEAAAERLATAATEPTFDTTQTIARTDTMVRVDRTRLADVSGHSADTVAVAAKACTDTCANHAVAA
jgi:hypothetical protein